MLDRKKILLEAEQKFKNNLYLDETLELLSRAVAIMNEEYSDFTYEGFEEGGNIDSALKRVHLRKFIKDKLDLSNKDTPYFVASFVWQNQTEDVLRWLITKM